MVEQIPGFFSATIKYKKICCAVIRIPKSNATVDAGHPKNIVISMPMIKNPIMHSRHNFPTSLFILWSIKIQLGPIVISGSPLQKKNT